MRCLIGVGLLFSCGRLFSHELPFRFEANQAQFVARGPGYSLALDASGSMLRLPGVELETKWIGADPKTHLEGLDPLPGSTNYLRGRDPGGWRTDIKSYARMRYAEIYPGIDLIFYGAWTPRVRFHFVARR